MANLSLADAQRITDEYSDVAFVPPPRSSIDVLSLPGLELTEDGPDGPLCDESLSFTLPDDEFQEMLKKLGDIGDSFAATQARNQFRRGSITRAIEYMDIALDRTKWNLDYAVRKSEQGIYFAHIMDFGSAERAVSTARARYNRSGKTYPPKAARVRFNSHIVRALVADGEGRPVRAEKHYRAALNEAGKGGVDGSGTTDRHGPGRYASAYLGLARSLTNQGRLQSAENVIRDLLHFRTSAHPEIRGRALQIFSQILFDQGRFDEAEVLANIAVSDFERLCVPQENIGLQLAIDTLGKSLVMQRRYEEAEEVFKTNEHLSEESVEAYRKVVGDNVFRAIAALHTGRLDDAIRMLDFSLNDVRGRKGSDHYDAAERIGLLAVAYSMGGQHERASRHFADATPILSAQAGWDEFDDESPVARERVRKLIFESYIRILFEEGSAEAAAEAFRLADFLNGGVARRDLALGSARLAANSPDLTDIVRRDQDTRKRIAALRATLIQAKSVPTDQLQPGVVNRVEVQIGELEAARSALSEDIRRRFPEYANLIKPEPMTIELVRQVLGSEESLIATYVGERKTFVWAVPKSGAVIFNAIEMGAQELANEVDKVRRTLAPKASTLRDIPDFDLATARYIYEQILQPVEAGWRGSEDLVVIADGPLGYLPFTLLPLAPVSALSDQDTLFSGYQEVLWLVRRHSVTILPSVASLRALRSLPAGPSDRRAFAGFGDPWFIAQSAGVVARQSDEDALVALSSRGASSARQTTIHLRALPNLDGVASAELARLPRLPETADEVRAIALALNADLTLDVFVGRSANEEVVKTLDLSNYKIIAFATHGLVPGDLNGLTQPALALTAPQVAGVEGDGLLTMGEILGLKLDADWVVLSACNTAAADGAGAEAISGLARAFFYAGARSMLVSNWPVETASAKALTTDLFQRQAKDPSINRAEALRQSMVALIDGPGFVDAEGQTVFSYAHPIFWAPFTLVGDGGNSQQPGI